MGYKVIEEWEDDWDFETLHDLLLEGFFKVLVVGKPWVPVMLFMV